MVFPDHLFASFARYLRLIVFDLLETVLTRILSSYKASAKCSPRNDGLKFKNSYWYGILIGPYLIAT